MKKHRPRKETCPNCGRRDIGAASYCPDCGQENHELDLPFRHLLSELLESTIHVDSNLFRTSKALLFRPGFLTREFVEGRRRRYVPPVRLYIFVSVLFFFLLAVLPGKGGSGHAPAEREANSLNLSFYSLSAKDLVGLGEVQVDSLMRAHQIEPTPWNRYIAGKLALIEQGGKSEFGHLMLKNISYMMFVLMPVFAFFVFVSYRRRSVFYLRSLVYTVHLHSFLFLLLSLVLLAGRLLPALSLLAIAAVMGMLYFYLSLLRFFREPVFRTMAKAAVLGALYLASMFGFFIAVVLLSIALF